jgi:hypothetical protein
MMDPLGEPISVISYTHKPAVKRIQQANKELDFTPEDANEKERIIITKIWGPEE